MKSSKKHRIFLALYHRGKLSLPPHRDELGLASFHWALLISRKNGAQLAHVIDVTDAMQIDPLTGVDSNPDQNWILRDKVDNPLSDVRLVLIAMIGKLKSRADGPEQLVETVKRECRAPKKGVGTEHCAWWVREAVRLLQAKGLLDEFDVDAIFLEAQQQAKDRIGTADMAKKRAEVINFSSRPCNARRFRHISERLQHVCISCTSWPWWS